MPIAVTCLSSAVWHGFYFGYIGLFTGLITQSISYKLFSKTRLAATLKDTLPSFVSILVQWLYTQTIMNYLGTCFCLLFLTPSLNMWASGYYYGHTVCFVLIAMAIVLPKQKRSGSGSSAKTGSKEGSGGSAKVNDGKKTVKTD